jgi:hypothetical protein
MAVAEEEEVGSGWRRGGGELGVAAGRGGTRVRDLGQARGY